MAKKLSERKLLVLLDSHAILHRAFHAIPDFATSKGEATGALYGLTTMLLKTIDDFAPDYIIAARDLPGGTFRDELFADYKGKRVEADPALIDQLIKAPEIFKAFGIPVYEAPGFEADDVIGTIVKKLSSDENIEIIIATGDMDTFQLISGDRVQVYTLRQGITDTILYDEDRVHERYGFGPERVIDFKGIRGDPSDNIPGVPGVGEVSAVKLIQKFGSLEDIYQALEKKGVEAVAKEAGVQKRYVQLVADNKEKALFSKQLATIHCDAPINFALPEKPWKILDSVDSIDAMCEKFEFRSVRERLRTRLRDAGDEPEEEVSLENVDAEELREVSIALWLLHSDYTEPTLQNILDYAETKDFSKAREFILKKIKDTGRLGEVFEKIEKPLIPVVQAMNARGVCIDRKELQKLQKEYSKELGEIAGRIFAHAGHEFNISSPKQLAVVLYDELKITPEKQKKTSTGQRTTKEEELAKLSDQHPIIEEVLQYRELQKLLSTYVEKIIELVGEDGRLRAEFLQAGTVTGRMGCQNPNLQNIPIRTNYGRRIRGAFNAPEGKCILSLDYSQIELRIAAGLSGDELLIDVFRSNRDIHTAVASQVFGVSEKEVDAEMRRRAKVINFGILYGMGVNALRQNLGGTVTRDEASTYLEQYFAKYPHLSKWVEDTKRNAERLGYVETVFGRRRYLPGFKSSLPMMRAQAERFAVNAPIQGTQADIIKCAMVKADERIAARGWEGKVSLILQVHDELVYEVDVSMVDDVVGEIKTVMETVITGNELAGVPIVAEGKVGPNWGDMRKI